MSAPQIFNQPQNQLLQQDKFVPDNYLENGKLIVVLKQHRFYKQLCLELYAATTTKTGKIKNPLTPVNPLDQVWKTNVPEELKFYSGIARFQNNATANKSASDIEALKSVIKNPLQLPFYYHKSDVSENVVANALIPVKVGRSVKDLQLFINKNQDFYDLSLEITIDGKRYNFNETEVKYDYFLLVDSTIHLIGSFKLVNVVQFFKQNKSLTTIHESRYQDFQQETLSKLEDKIEVFYSYIQAGTQEQIAAEDLNNTERKLIYLSDLENFVIIEPVILYGSIDIPILTKKQIYSRDNKGEIFTVKRNEEAEIKFAALLLKQHHYFKEQIDFDLPYFYLHKQRFLNEDWFLNAFEEWENHGITILGFNKLRGNKLNGNKAKITIHVTSGTNWFNTEITAGFGKKKASLKQLQQAVRNKNKYVHLDDGTIGILPQEWVEKFAAYFNAAEILDDKLFTPKINFTEVSQLYEAEELDLKVKRELKEFAALAENFDSIKTVEVPHELNATLREYQKHGLNWLNFLDDYNFGGCLADDMGLGKSIQIIAFILLLRNKRKHNTNLLVVPTSLIFNWKAEVEKFAPSIKVLTIYSAGKTKNLDSFDDYEIILISYGT
ncbi:MAG TPA: DEAD/DEAH box helicase, partial [Segetibacter sp.]